MRKAVSDLLAEGRALLDEHDPFDAHGAFGSWVDKVAIWLERKPQGTALSAHWSGLSHSHLRSSAGGFYDDLNVWEEFRSAVQERLIWLGQALPARSKPEGATVVSNATPPTYARKTVIAAADILKALGHTGLDRFLLELGLPEDYQDGGRGGGLLARANYLAKYAIENPTFLTPERITLPYAIIKCATDLWRQETVQNLGRGEREKFEVAMRAEGQEENLKGEQDSIPNVPRSFWSASASKAGGSHVSPNPVQQVAAQPSRKVFVVHGRDEGAKNAVELFLRTIGIEPIILHKQAHLGRHLLTKFSQEAADVAFAVILMTPDDEGCEKGGTPNPRARQNVVFELGFFIGKFETARVAALITKGVEKPSDFDGIGYIDFDATGGWKTLLARELKGAGIPFDANAVLHA